MFGTKFGQCSGEQIEVFARLFFTGARAARFPTPVTPFTSLLLVHNSPSVPREAVE